MKKLFYIVVLTSALLLSGCNKTMPVKNYTGQNITQYSNQNLKESDVERAILRGAISLGWKAKTVSEGKIRAELNIRKHQLILMIEHDDKTYSINYVDSTNLSYDGENIHRQYHNWINHLINSINAFSLQN